jgi:transposase
MLTATQDNEEIIERVAALDIGKAELMCCVRVPDGDHPGKRLQEVQAYATMTRSVLGLADHLGRLGVTRVVMEATSVTGSRCSTCWRRPGSRPGW